MSTCPMDLPSADGARNCLLAVMCGRDLAAIVLAKSLLRMNRTRTSRIVVWRADKMIFEGTFAQMLN
jgi:hypothetical protein